MANKYKATCPDGTIVTRKSKSRTYTHVLVVKDKEGKWGQFGWIGRPDLINAKICEVARFGYTGENVKVLEAEPA